MPDQLHSHLLVDGFVTSSDFKSPLSVQRDPAPQRNRQAHGTRLLRQVQSLVRESVRLNQERAQHELPNQAGMTVAIEVRPKGALDPKTFEWKRDGVEVLTVGGGDAFDLVTIHVPDGKLSALERRVEEYVHKDNAAGTKPANASLINAIENVRRAAFAELWTHNAAPPPDAEVRWYQVWLRQAGKKSGTTRNDFAELAAKLAIVVEPGYVSFPGRVVVAVQCTRQALENALQLLDMVAEIRGVEPTAEFFLAHLKPAEQAEWIEQLVARTVQPDGQAPFVTLLDTGVNRGHPLLRASLDAGDVHTVHPQWPANDHVGHGTEMAGLALYGDLTSVLASTEQVSLPHRLESVKIWPDEGENPSHLYGPVCIEAVSRVEVQNAGRRRTFAMMTTSSGTNIGEGANRENGKNRALRRFGRAYRPQTIPRSRLANALTLYCIVDIYDRGRSLLGKIKDVERAADGSSRGRQRRSDNLSARRLSPQRVQTHPHRAGEWAVHRPRLRVLQAPIRLL